MKTVAVIMAGGRGERFWPRSRQDCPKQFLSLNNDGKTMLQQTAQRLLPFLAYEELYIVSNCDYISLIKKQMPQIPAENILFEPLPKSTAPCIGYAAAVISKKYEDAVMLIIPSDHLIQDNEKYIELLIKAVDVAKRGRNLVTIGITPTYPETGYGYICFEPDETSGAHAVLRFVEKPDLDTAKAYLASGRYLWNSGIFVCKLSTIFSWYQELLPELYRGLLTIKEAWGSASFESVLAQCYSEFPSISVDYGIMEHASGIFTIPGDFGWDDAGSFLVLERMNKTDEHGNIVRGNVVAIDTENSIVMGDKKLIAAVGLADLLIVDTQDALLICDKAHAQDIKNVIQELRKSNRTEFL